MLLLSKWVCHFIAVIKLFLSPLNSLLNERRQGWIITAETQQKVALFFNQEVVGPGSNYVENSGLFESVFHFILENKAASDNVNLLFINQATLFTDNCLKLGIFVFLVSQ